MTEELTRVNLPATQVLVCSGVPLERIDQVRRFYGAWGLGPMMGQNAWILDDFG